MGAKIRHEHDPDRSARHTGRMALTAVLGAAAREGYAVVRASTPTHRRFRDRLTAVVVATVGMDAVCALLAFAFEHHAKQTQINNVGDALFWTSTQLLTVSSSIQNPITTAGRVLDVLMEAYAITVIATLAGAAGAFFHKRGDELAAEEAAKHGER
jgi:hypothetical protein